MKSTVEQLGPTRVRINVEVPFDELKPSFDRAYRKLAQQVRIPGFRPGKAPARVLESRLGRGVVLDEVVNEVIPAKYLEAVNGGEIQALGRPDIEVTKLEDGELLAFTAEVDVRPEITLPAFDELSVTVDNLEVTDEEVTEQLDQLRARFGTLTGVERPVQNGDFVSIDLTATVDGKEVEDARTSGLSYEVGSGQLVEGLDEAIVGLKEGESKTFTTKLAAGEHAGKEAEVTVTVKSVKERELPEPDDEFAQLASEFDTIEELKNSLVEQVRRVKRVQQAEQIRDKVLETLLEQVEVPLPEKVVQAQIDDTLHNAIHALDHDEARFAELLEAQGSSREQWDADNRANAEKAIKTQLLVDAIADKLNVQVGQNDLTERLVLMSQQYGMQPQQLLQALQQNNQLPALFADVRRGLAVAEVVEGATVKDTEGNVIDTTEFFGRAGAQQAEAEGSNDEEPADAESSDDSANEESADAE